MSPEKPSRMANQIAAFFGAKPQDEAVDGVADHINRFWEPRMRTQLLEMLESGGAGFHPSVLAALPKIRRPKQQMA